MTRVWPVALRNKVRADASTNSSASGSTDQGIGRIADCGSPQPGARLSHVQESPCFMAGTQRGRWSVRLARGGPPWCRDIQPSANSMCLRWAVRTEDACPRRSTPKAGIRPNRDGALPGDRTPSPRESLMEAAGRLTRGRSPDDGKSDRRTRGGRFFRHAVGGS